MKTRYALLVPAVVLVALTAIWTPPATAQTGVAWFYWVDGNAWRNYADGTVTTIGMYSVTQNPISPSAALFGHPPQAGLTGEIAVEQKVLSVGDFVPLPTYADGSSAKEEEVFWTAQLWEARFHDGNQPSDDRYLNGDYSVAGFQGRQLAGGVFKTGVSVQNVISTTDLRVLVNVVAVRPLVVTTTRRSTMGAVKARYR